MDTVHTFPYCFPANPAQREEKLVWQGDGCHTSSFCFEFPLPFGLQGYDPVALRLCCAAFVGWEALMFFLCGVQPSPTACSVFHPVKALVGYLGTSPVHTSVFEAYGLLLHWLEISC